MGVRKVGKAVLLVPLEHGWDSLFESLAEFSDDFLAERTQLRNLPRPSLERKPSGEAPARHEHLHHIY